MLMMLVPFALVIRYGVVAREEAYLERKFGNIYRGYRSALAVEPTDRISALVVRCGVGPPASLQTDVIVTLYQWFIEAAFSWSGTYRR
jgi:hypothetical protein